ncbi:MAG: amidohydrolase [Gammaproteobacteria bacterium]|nr:amidohydrolase [Gammaproteobacteria bacterium]
MTHDIVIRNGTLIDGTGAAAQEGDLAIDDGMITAVGDVPGKGSEELDAKGHLVTPGFVDLHTHLDAQIGWDPMLTPISWQGVTTALLGNCGVTFAPCKEEDRELIAAMMETVEDIPRDAILTGLPWSWEHYGQYLDTLESLQPAINVGGLVGHCAVRYYVMGDRSANDQPNEQEQAEIARIAGQAVRDGAVGFSTNRFLGHYMPDGRHVPGTHAHHEEVEAIAREVGAAGGLMQNVLNLGGDFEGEAALLRKEALASGGRVLFSITAGAKDTSGNRVRAMLDDMQADGLDVSSISVPRGTGGITGLQCGLPWRSGAWKELADMDFEGRLKAISDTSMSERLVRDAENGNAMGAMTDIFWMGDGEQPLHAKARSLAELAEAAIESPAETFLRITRDSGGKALFTMRAFNKNMTALANLISSDRCFPGLGDAGAHVSQVMDGGWATFVLTHWCKEAGLYDLPEAVRRITSGPARIMGVNDRGVLAVGKRADVNVIDYDNLHEKMPQIVHDFPFGSPRFIQRAAGYKATICNGQFILRDDELTGTRAGTVLRNTASA